MINVLYEGRFGNWMFQYTYAKLLAIKLGLAFNQGLPRNNIFNINSSVVGNTFNAVQHIYEDLEDKNWKISVENDHSICLHGYFQRWYLYRNDIDLIKSFFNCNIPIENDEDVCMHIRLTDYYNFKNGVMNKSKYLDLLKTLKFKTLYIVTDDPKDKYLENFKLYNLKIVSTADKYDFFYMMKFNKIIVGNSTFSWWAAFLSNAQHKYVSNAWWSSNQIGLQNMGIEY